MRPIPAPEELPAQMPHLRDNWRRAACRGVMRLAGWRLVGEFPNVPKLVMIVAPHSSWWDGIWGLFMKVGIGAGINFMAKQELFRPPLGRLLRGLGGIPIARRAAHGVVEQMIERFDHQDRLWLGIEPEGTRRHVAKWKSGFWYIAHRARVPVFPVAFNYPDKTIHLGPLHPTTGDLAADTERLRAFYRPYQGKHHGL